VRRRPTRGSRSVAGVETEFPQGPGTIVPGPSGSQVLKVVHLGKYYPPSPGGIESHTRTLAQAQAALGADVSVVVINHAAPDGRDATFDRFTRTHSVEEFDGPVRVVRVGRLANVAKLDAAPGLLAVLGKEARRKPSVWHMHAPNVTMMLALAARPRIGPLVVTHHSDIVRQRVLKYAVRPLETLTYRRAARVLSDSPPYADGSPLLKAFAAKTDVLPLGIDQTPFRSPSAAGVGFAADLRRRYASPLWVSVGRLIYYKGLHVALEALRGVAGTLLVVGTGPLQGELQAKAAELGVADRVAWLGNANADQLTGSYLAATALWFPSIARSEGFGLVQVEAMASGCPVVNTAVPASGVSWVCRHEREGLTVPMNDAPALAAAANRLLSEPGLRDRLAPAGVERAAAEFDWRVMGERSLAIYRAAGTR
jgi:glycosyltransferase involved in cell wall biosynthesis